MKWLKENNRMKKFYLGIPTGLLTILFTLGIATGLKLKDDKFDWYDWLSTVLGGAIGQLILLLIIWLL